MGYGGAQWKINNNMMLQGAYHRADNLLDMGWVDLDMVHRFDKDRTCASISSTSTRRSNGKQESRRLLHEQQGRLSSKRAGCRGASRMPRSAATAMATSCARRSASGRRTWCSASAKTRRPAKRRGSSARLSTSRPRRARPRLRRQLRPAHRSALARQQAQPLADWKELATDLIYTFGKEFGWAQRHPHARALGAGLGDGQPVFRRNDHGHQPAALGHPLRSAMAGRLRAARF